MKPNPPSVEKKLHTFVSLLNYGTKKLWLLYANYKKSNKSCRSCQRIRGYNRIHSLNIIPATSDKSPVSSILKTDDRIHLPCALCLEPYACPLYPVPSLSRKHRPFIRTGHHCCVPGQIAAFDLGLKFRQLGQSFFNFSF